MGSVLAELLVARGCEVDFVTPAAKVAGWTENTLEQRFIQTRLMEMGVRLHLSHAPGLFGAWGRAGLAAPTRAPSAMLPRMRR